MSAPAAQASLLVNGYEVVIGFETHAQLSTASKIFSRSAVAFGAEPNVHASPVDLALPGALPVMNKGAVERAIQLGLAVNAHVAEKSVFARKNYFYPDLPKGYQISQFEIPVVQGGEVSFFLGDEKKTVRLVRAHLDVLLGPQSDFIPVMLQEWRVLTPEQTLVIRALKDDYEAHWTPVLAALHAQGVLRWDVALARMLLFGALNWSIKWYDVQERLSLDGLTDEVMLLLVPAAFPGL